MIDHQIGKILQTLEHQGYLDNSVVIFTSDHGDCLGDHGHSQKWTMYDSVATVPLVFWSPGRIPAGETDGSLVQLTDVAPTILNFAGLPVPKDFEATTLLPKLGGNGAVEADEVVYSELGRDHIQSGAEYIVMRRDRDWKLVYYQGEPDGELYDLNADPDEVENLWAEADYREQRDFLTNKVQDWIIANMRRAHMPTGRKPQPPLKL